MISKKYIVVVLVVKLMYLYLIYILDQIVCASRLKRGLTFKKNNDNFLSLCQNYFKIRQRENSFVSYNY